MRLYLKILNLSCIYIHIYSYGYTEILHVYDNKILELSFGFNLF